MALIVEDGTGLSNAESYISVADANAYHTARANDAWSELETLEKEQHLRRATDYMLAVYRERWKGYRTKDSQALDWPRESIYIDARIDALANNLIPSEVKRACAELALRSITESLAPDIERATTEETVGPITVKYAAGPTNKRFRFVDALLSPYLSASGGMYKLVR